MLEAYGDGIMDVPKAKSSMPCRQCRKNIKTEAWKCVPCDKLFHPSCIKLYKVYNTANELVPCKGKAKNWIIKMMSTNVKEISNSKGDTKKVTIADSEKISEDVMEQTNVNVNTLYELLREMKDEVDGTKSFKNAIADIIKEKMERVRSEIRVWMKVELKKAINNIVRDEMQEVIKTMSSTNITESMVRRKKVTVK